MADIASSPIQKLRRSRRERNGRLVDQMAYLVTNISPGSTKEIYDALPQMGSPHPEGLDGFVVGHGLATMIDGTRAIATVTYDTQAGPWGGSGYFIRTGRTEGRYQDYDVPVVKLLEPGIWALGPPFRFTRYTMFRREVRRATGMFVLDNVTEAITANLGKVWYTRRSSNGQPTSLPYVFINGSVQQVRPEEAIIQYEFIVQSPLSEISGELIGSDADPPELGTNQRWAVNLNPGTSNPISVVKDFIDEPVTLPYL